ncbi:MAG: ClbS/DfsB family four-helix bundle protein [Herpetosiphonaceae bacterium]|nr:ClbS/DfsB family four-helix bundle protein [Herpetosiphonaceae bacterium]
MTEAAPNDARLTSSELLDRIDSAWTNLNQMLADLSEPQRTTAHDQENWRVKDHLTHLAAWEQSLLALLEGRDRHQAFGLGAVDLAGMDYDQINARIQQHHAHLSHAESLALAQHSHTQLRAAIAALSDADLQRPYAHFQPNTQHENAQLPVINWIAGNTYEHYAEHQGWIGEWVNRG